MAVKINNKFITAGTEVLSQREIEVVSSIMGTGKSTAIIKRLNDKPATHRNPVLIILPYLKEVDRFIKEVTSVNLIEPDTANITGAKAFKNKSEALESLLEAGDSIVATHALFELLTPKAKRLIKLTGYEIILDEVLGCVKPMKGIKPTTIKEMLELKLISIDPTTKQIIRNYDKAPVGYDSSPVHNRVIKACTTGFLYMLGDDRMFIQELPADLFQIAKKYTILTFQFEQSDLKHFFDIKDIKWSYKTDLVCPVREAQIKASIKDLITYEELPVKTAPAMKKLLKSNSILTKAWHNKLTPKVATQIRNFFSNTLKSSWDVKKEELLYTGPKDWYSEESKQNKNHLKLPGYRTFKDADDKKQHCWVAFNTKGTNDFANRNFVLFNYKLCPDGTIPEYFRQQVKRTGLGTFDTKAYQDAYALNHMIQFIWRSAIRNGKPVRVYIANPVMKTLFQEWVDSMDAEGNAYLHNNAMKAA